MYETGLGELTFFNLSNPLSPFDSPENKDLFDAVYAIVL
jgi:hypothetical protein